MNATNGSQPETMADLRERIVKLERINAVLIDRVENSADQQPNAYSLFQTAIALERQVKLRSDDLTRTLRRLEQMNDQLMLAKDIADRANQSKTQYLVHAGHDLLQPLSAAGIALEELTEMLHGDKAIRLSHQIKRALFNIEELLKALLDISKLDAGIIEPNKTPVSVGEVLAELNADYIPWAARRRLELRIRPTNVFVMTDRAMFTRILQNLICNALRYTAKGRVLVGVRRMQQSVRVDVIDTGPGIAQDQHARIFEEFHRGHAYSTNGEKGLGLGLGLGLAIVQRLVNTLEGHRISLRSEVDHGTCFSIELPRAEARSLDIRAASRPLRILQDSFSGIRVVFIGDEDPVQGILRHWRCELIVASNEEEASHLIIERGQSPDLLLLSQDAIALTTITKLRAAFGQNIPAILFTTNGCNQEEGQGGDQIELLSKPVRPAELRALMAHLLR